jgi:hypothetical protein
LKHAEIPRSRYAAEVQYSIALMNVKMLFLKNILRLYLANIRL